MADAPRSSGDFARLAAHLDVELGPRLTLTFAEVEAITGELLPFAATLGTQWWRSGSYGRAHSFAWRSVGWDVEQVDPYAGTVTFVRTESPAPGARGGP